MGTAFSWVLALHYLRSRWLVNLFSMVGVTVAVWALITVPGVFAGFIGDIRTEVRRSAPDLLLTGLPHATGFEPLRAALVDPDVVAVAPRLRHYGMFYGRASARPAVSVELEFSNVDNSFVQLLGIDPALEPAVTPFREWLERGRKRRQFDATDQRAVDLGPLLQVPAELEFIARRRLGLPVPSRAADWQAIWPGLLLGRDRISRQGLMLGEPVDVVSVDFAPQRDGARGGVVALQATFAFAGAFRTGARLFDDTTAVLPIETLRTMLGHDARDDDSIDLVTDVAIRARDGMSAAELQALAARLLPRALAVLPPSLPDAARPEVLTWEQQNPVFLDAIDTERAMMTTVVFAVMLIAAFLVYATLHMMVTQKIRDIGIISALGGAPRGVGRIFVQCGFVLGSIGVVLGLLAGVLSLWAMNPVNSWLDEHYGVALFPPELFDLREIPYRIEPDWLVGVALGALLLALVVAWLPARRAARMQPVEALSHE